MTDLILGKVSFAYHKKPILVGVEAQFKAGSLTALVGLNGTGKSTCLKLAAGLLTAKQGSVCFSDGTDFDDRQHRTRRIAYLPQFQPVAWALACRDIVRLGRVPYGEDEAAVLAAMQFCDVAHFADMAIDTISGGEQARVLLARVLAGAADIYLLDEPVRSLDLRRQVQVMALLKAQARMGKAVVIVLHDLSLAARFCDEVVLLNEQSIIQQGAPQSVFTAQQLHSIFGVEMDMVWNKSA